MVPVFSASGSGCVLYSLKTSRTDEYLAGAKAIASGLSHNYLAQLCSSVRGRGRSVSTDAAPSTS